MNTENFLLSVILIKQYFVQETDDENWLFVMDGYIHLRESYQKC